MKKILFVGLTTGLFTFCAIGAAQAITITQTNDAATLSSALGSNITINTITGNASQFGTYTNSSGVYGGIGSGIVLSSGNVNDYNDGSNFDSATSTEFNGAGQADLSALSGGATFDAATIEFSFVATHDQLSFDFVFGSEEYAEYIGFGVNDTFGAFINGAGGTNVSTDQYGKSITIDSAWMTDTTGTELDGVTSLLHTVYGGLVVGDTYNFMFGIADGGDSTVYLSNFIGSTGGQVGTTPDPVPEPTTMLLFGAGLIGLAGAGRRKKK